MSTEAFAKDGWDWQFSLFQQKIGEWVEYQFSQFQGTLPELPTWSLSPQMTQVLKILFWVVLGLFLAWVAWRLWQEFYPYIYSLLDKISNSGNSRSNTSVREPSGAILLTQAQEFSRQGNYREACRCLYLAMLQHLHEKAIALQQPSRTDGEYLQLLSTSVTPIQPYETLITTHEQLCFSNAEILPDNYQQCQQAYGEISHNQQQK
jgi:hypothetical protein